MVHFVKEVFRGQGEFDVNRPAEIRIGDSLIMISDGGGLRESVSAFLYVKNVDEQLVENRRFRAEWAEKSGTWLRDS